LDLRRRIRIRNGGKRECWVLIPFEIVDENFIGNSVSNLTS
jgi:hypothetical protein